MADKVTKTLLQSEALQQYILDTSAYPREHELLKELKEATMEKYGRWRELNIPSDEGLFLSMLLKLTREAYLGDRCIHRVFSADHRISDTYRWSAISISWQIIAIDTDKEAYEVGLPMIEKAGVSHMIKFIQSDAISVLDKLIGEKEIDGEGGFDFVFVDADKTNYVNYHERVMKLLKVGGVVAYDNTLLYATVIMEEEEAVESLRSKGFDEGLDGFIVGRASIIEFNKLLASDSRVDISQVSIGDGVTLCRRVR